MLLTFFSNLQGRLVIYLLNDRHQSHTNTLTSFIKIIILTNTRGPKSGGGLIRGQIASLLNCISYSGSSVPEGDVDQRIDQSNT